ncbi:MAG: hypothetical protein E7052_01930 [Lentisphaerae bacterium]|nr:hypothetical protein [Lentisphaerota bacterium]
MTFRTQNLAILLSAVITGSLLVSGSWRVCAREFDDALYWAEMPIRNISAADYRAIWQQTIPPHQAAEMLMTAGNFETIPGSFAPYLHRLYYRLGILTHSRQSRWTPEITAICTKLQRCNALFSMLGSIRTNRASQIALLAMPQAGVLPPNDVQPLTEAVPHPCWTAAPGEDFQAAIIALPCRAQLKVNVQMSLLNSSNAAAPLPVVLQKVDYFYQNGKWQQRFTQVNSAAQLEYMQIYLLQIQVPGNYPAGIYHGYISMQPAGAVFPAVLHYQLNVKR